MTDMYTYRHVLSCFLILLVAVAMTACDQGAQNYDYESGSSLSIAGPTEVVVPDTTSYYVRAFTIEKDYSWSVNGNDPLNVRRDGEYIDAAIPSTGVYTIEVDDGEYTGSLDVQAVRTDMLSQADRYSGNFGLLTTAAQTTSLTDTLSGGGPLTLLGPNQEAILDAFDANDDGELASSEIPAPDVMADILRYHTLADSLESGDISDGDQVETLLEDGGMNEQLSFSVSNGEIQAGGATVTDPFDLPATSGYLHAVDQVISPPIALADFRDQESAEGDTVVTQTVNLPEGGFVVMHDSTELADGNVINSIRGHSEYLEAGIHKNVEIVLDNSVSDGTVLGAMPHQDTNDNETYDFTTSVGTEDGPYTRDGNAVIDYGVVTVP
jgi:uncharacterized surface protein with fasciclin (FAS1) repeats